MEARRGLRLASACCVKLGSGFRIRIDALGLEVHGERVQGFASGCSRQTSLLAAVDGVTRGGSWVRGKGKGGRVGGMESGG